MITFGRFILLAVAAVGLSVSAYAEMTPTAECDAGSTAVWHDEETGVCFADLVGEFALPSAIDFDWQAAGLAPLPQPEPAGDEPPVVVLTDGHDSMTLCLYALMGLGLCKSAPWVRKFSFGVVPQWYHDGGPQQIGHSLAVSPDCYCPAPVCFVQPEPLSDHDLTPQYAWGTVMSLWRHSQATPATLAGRAPPAWSC